MISYLKKNYLHINNSVDILSINPTQAEFFGASEDGGGGGGVETTRGPYLEFDMR